MLQIIARTPFIIIVSHLKVVWADLAICQLTQSPAQISVPMAVVRRVEELPTRSPKVTLRH